MTAELIAKIAKEASTKAVEATFKAGLPITVLKGENIVKIYPDGKVEFIKKIEKPYVTVKKEYIIYKCTELKHAKIYNRH